MKKPTKRPTPDSEKDYLLDLSYFVIETLRRHAHAGRKRGDGPMNQADLLEKLQEDFPELAEEFSKGKVRGALEKLIALQEAFPNWEQPPLRYIYSGGEMGPVTPRTDDAGPKRRIQGYWADASPPLFRDAELKFLIDSVMYNNTIGTEAARDLARRLQKLGGRTLRSQTPYISGAFGQRRYQPPKDTDLLENLTVLMNAMNENKQVSFYLNPYQVKGGRIIPFYNGAKKHILSPVELILSGGCYYLLGVYPKKEKVYFFQVDLMSQVKKRSEARVNPRNIPELSGFRRGDYGLKHPVLYDGAVKTFTLQVHRDHLTPVVNTFGENLRLLSEDADGQTVTVLVEASEGAMERWLVQHGDYLTAIDMDSDFAKRMRARAAILWEKYGN